MRPLRLHQKDGSIFIEVLIGLILLAGGMAAGLEMMRTAQTALDSARTRVLAMTLAQSFLEEKGASSPENILEGPSAGEEVFGRITREWRITSPPSGFSGVTVQVESRWTDRSGRNLRVALSLFLPGGRVP